MNIARRARRRKIQKHINGRSIVVARQAIFVRRLSDVSFDHRAQEASSAVEETAVGSIQKALLVVAVEIVASETVEEDIDPAEVVAPAESTDSAEVVKMVRSADSKPVYQTFPVAP